MTTGKAKGWTLGILLAGALLLVPQFVQDRYFMHIVVMAGILPS